MYEYIIIGGGIESIVQALTIFQHNVQAKIAFVTQNKVDNSGESSTWGVSFRHVSEFDGMNFLSKFHEKNLSKSVTQGGWLCKNKNLNKDEILWLKNRKLFCQNSEFILKVNNFFQKFNEQSLKKWQKFIKNNKNLMWDTNLICDINLHSNIYEKIYSKNSFSFDIGKLCNNIIKSLKNVSFFYDTKISSIQFHKGKINYLVSDKNIIFQAKHYIFSPGAYGNELFKVFGLSHRLNSVLGIWMRIDDVKISKPFKYHYFKDENLTSCQSYTPVGDNSVIVGTGCAWIGNDFSNICPIQKENFINYQKQIISKVFSNKKITVINDNCLRLFSDNNFPIIKSGDTILGGRYVVVGGTGTFTTMGAFSTAEYVLSRLHTKEYV